MEDCVEITAEMICSELHKTITDALNSFKSDIVQVSRACKASDTSPRPSTATINDLIVLKSKNN